MRKILLAVLVASQFAYINLSFAEESSGATEDRLSYPELEVAPRATERVQIEARKELRGRWLVHLPIQASSVLTLVAAGMAKEKADLSQDEKTKFDERIQNANYVGAGWLITSTLMAGLYKPYTSGIKELKQISVKSKRDELTRERIAEEILYRPATVAKAMKWFSVITQVAVNAALIDNNEDKSAAVAAVAMIGAFAPVIFNHAWIENADNHRLYKKRIYGPIAGPVLLQESASQYALGYGLSYSF